MRRLAVSALRNVDEARTAGVLMDVLEHGSAADHAAVLWELPAFAPLLTEPQRHLICDALALQLPNRDVNAALNLARMGDKRGASLLAGRLLSAPDANTVEALSMLTGQPWKLRERNRDVDDGEQVRAENKKLADEIVAYLKDHGYAVTPAAGATMREADRALLLSLFDDGLFDPAKSKAEYVRVTMRWPEFWATKQERDFLGWLTRKPNSNPNQKGEPDTITFESGMVRPAPASKDAGKIEALNYLDFVQQMLGEAENPNFWERNDSYSNVFPRAIDRWVYWTAWLLKLGETEKAERLFALACPSDACRAKLADDVHAELAWQAMFNATLAFRERDDAAALTAVTRASALLAKLSAARSAPNQEFSYYAPDIRALEADLQRRKRDGTFGTPPADLAAITKLPLEQRIPALIRSLEDISASTSTGKDMSVEDWYSDPRIAALVDCGDAAVPALIDCVEKDSRLTHYARFWRGEGDQGWDCTPVKKVAWNAVLTILADVCFDPAHPSKDRNYVNYENADAAANLRAFWAAYGTLPLLDRSMKILTDPRVHPGTALLAARALASQGGAPEARGWGLVHAPRGKIPPAQVAQYQAPSAAEAMLTLFDRGLADFDRGLTAAQMKGDITYFEHRRMGEEDIYLRPLLQLHDVRIVPALKARFARETSPRTRVKWSFVLNELGESAELQTIAQEITARKFALPPDPLTTAKDNESAAAKNMTWIITLLANSESPLVDAALNACTEPSHPFYKEFVAAFEDDRSASFWHNSRVYLHPSCLRFLRNQLDATAPDGRTWRVCGKRVCSHEANGERWDTLPEFIADPASRREKADGRVCDRYAMMLPKLLWGFDVPKYHPLLQDPDARLAELRRFLDTNLPRIRKLTRAELDALAHGSYVYYAPDIQPLNRLATPADVTAGRAVFSRPDSVKLAPLKLPATALLKKDANEDWPSRVLIVQAELDAAGKLHCGILEEHGSREIAGDELDEMKPVDAER